MPEPFVMWSYVARALSDSLHIFAIAGRQSTPAVSSPLFLCLALCLMLMLMTQTPGPCECIAEPKCLRLQLRSNIIKLIRNDIKGMRNISDSALFVGH